MKALSLWQPFASLVAAGIKTFETRSWKTEYRGPLLIHASLYCPDEEVRLLAAKDPRFRDAIEKIGPMANWPRGAALAIVDLVACQSTALIGLDEVHREGAFGDFGPCRFAWKLNLLQVLPAPIPLKGRQGFFEVPWISWQPRLARSHSTT